MFTQLEIEKHFDNKLHIAYLNQPDTFNSLNQTLLKELRQFIIDCNDDENVRCIGISGRGKAFCSGQNLKEALAIGMQNNDDKVIQKIVIELYNPLVREISESPKPVISLVNGPAVGAGAMLALICDFTLATENSYFSQAFVNIGLIPDTGGTYFLPKLLSRQQASYLAFTGKKISAQEAKSMGIIADVFADAEFTEKTMEVLEQISNAPTTAIGLTKAAFNLSYENTIIQQLELEGIYQQQPAETSDFKEGIQAFLEKRKPNYTGE